METRKQRQRQPEQICSRRRRKHLRCVAASLPSCPANCCQRPDFGHTHGLACLGSLSLSLALCGCSNMSCGNNLCSLRSHKLIDSKCLLCCSLSACCCQLALSISQAASLSLLRLVSPPSSKLPICSSSSSGGYTTQIALNFFYANRDIKQAASTTPDRTPPALLHAAPHPALAAPPPPQPTPPQPPPLPPPPALHCPELCSSLARSL